MQGRSSLVGRDAEIALLERFVDALRSGAGGVTLIQGEPGIGKTALLTRTRDRFTGELPVLVASARRLERDRPFGLLFDALGSDPRVASVAAEHGIVTGSGSAQGRLPTGPDEGLGMQWRIVESVGDTVETVCRETPLLVMLDDLHWADTPSVIAIGHLVRRLSDVPLGLLLTMRVGTAHTHVDALVEDLAERDTMVLRLGPLSDDDVASLIRDRLPADRVGAAAEYVRRAGGNPLFVTELLASFQREPAIDVTEVTPDLRAVVRRRLSSLDEEAVGALRVAAVLGTRFSLHDLVVALGRPVTTLMQVLDDAVRQGLLEADGDDLVFRHELVRDAIYEDLSLAVRTALHRQIGRELADAEAPALRVAPHMSAGANVGDADAVTWLRRAASEASRRSPRVASELLRRALDLTPRDGRDRLEIEGALVAALAAAGRASEARRVAGEALPRASGALRQRLQLHVARCFYTEGRYQEAADAYVGVVAEVSAPTPEVVALVSEAAVACASAHRLDEAERLLTRARDLGTAARDPLVEARTWRAGRIIEDYRYRSGRATKLTEAAAPAIEAGLLGDEERCHFYFYRGIDLRWLDRYEEALEAFRTGRRLAEKTGREWHLPRFQTALGDALFQGGDWDDAVAELEAGVALVRETDTRWGAVELYGSLAAIHGHRGDFADAWEALEFGERRANETDRTAEWLLPARILLTGLEGDGRAGDLIDALAASIEDDVVAGFNEMFTVDLVRCAIRSGRARYAERIAAALERVASKAELATFSGTAEHCLGLVSDDPDALIRAVHFFSPESRPFQRAQASEDAAAALMRAGRTDEIDRFASEAFGIYRDLGAVVPERRLERALSGSRAARASPRAPARPKAGWESLTSSEVKVAALVAEGLTNPEIARRLFVSRYTVATHLRHIFEKLGITSRTQLATEVVRRSTSPASR